MEHAGGSGAPGGHGASLCCCPPSSRPWAAYAPAWSQQVDLPQTPVLPQHSCAQQTSRPPLAHQPAGPAVLRTSLPGPPNLQDSESSLCPARHPGCPGNALPAGGKDPPRSLSSHRAFGDDSREPGLPPDPTARPPPPPARDKQRGAPERSSRRTRNQTEATPSESGVPHRALLTLYPEHASTRTDSKSPRKVLDIVARTKLPTQHRKTLQPAHARVSTRAEGQRRPECASTSEWGHRTGQKHLKGDSPATRSDDGTAGETADKDGEASSARWTKGSRRAHERPQPPPRCPWDAPQGRRRPKRLLRPRQDKWETNSRRKAGGFMSVWKVGDTLLDGWRPEEKA